MPRLQSATTPPTSDCAAWTVLLFLGAAAATVQWRAPLAMEAASFAKLFVACLTLGAAAFFYRRVRPEEKFAAMCIGLMQVLLFTALAAILSYLLAREGGALWDARLTEWDRALGFDWLAYVRWIDQHPWLAALLRLTYVSLVPQVILLVLALGFTLRVTELRTVLLGAMISGTAIVLLSPLFPALSNFVQLGLTAADFRAVDPHAGYLHLADLQALRSGSMEELRLTAMQGIITFPSYHAGLATVTLWGFWRCGILPLQVGGGGLAVLTLLATPVDGGHYLVDVLAGMAIGGVAILAAQRAVRWSPGRPVLTAWPSRHSRAASAP